MYGDWRFYVVAYICYGLWWIESTNDLFLPLFLQSVHKYTRELQVSYMYVLTFDFLSFDKFVVEV